MANNIYPAVSVTVPNTKTSLLSLLQTADPTIAPRGREITLQNDPANANNILVGNGGLTSGNYGYVLRPGDNRTYRAASMSDAAALPVMYVMTNTGTAQLNVEIVPL